MNTYRIRWTEEHEATVDAINESAARQAWIDGYFDTRELPVFDLTNVDPIVDDGVTVE